MSSSLRYSLVIAISPLALKTHSRQIITFSDGDLNVQTPVGSTTTYLVKAEPWAAARATLRSDS